jgi:pseudo-response regulator 7
VRTQKSTKSNGADESDNDTGSNDDDGIGSVGLNARDGSDNGSGTQVIFFCFFYRQAYTLIFM